MVVMEMSEEKVYLVSVLCVVLLHPGELDPEKINTR
jgi:hypothetical protein